MSRAREAAELFDEILRADPDRWVERFSRDAAAWAARGLKVGHALPLRPRFMDESDARRVEAQAGLFLRSLQRVPGEAFGGDVKRIAAFLRMPAIADERVTRSFRPEFRCSMARPDAFIWAGETRFIEANAGSGIAGFNYIQWLLDYYGQSPLMAEVGRRIPFRMLGPVDGLARLFAPRVAAGQRIAYLDLRDLATGDLYEKTGLHVVAMLADRGVPMEHMTVERTRFEGGRLTHEGRAFDCGFRNYPSELMLEDMPGHAAVLEACEAGSLDMVDHPYDRVLGNKMLMAFLSDPARRGFLSAEDAREIDRFLPWTRLLRDEPTRYDGAEARVPELALARKDDWVLKKGASFQGVAVHFGRTRSAADWEQAVRAALAEQDWVLQRVTEPPTERVPFLVDGRIVFEDVIQMACPYMIEGRLAGFLCRNSLPGGSPVLAIRSGGNAQAGLSTVALIS